MKFSRRYHRVLERYRRFATSDDSSASLNFDDGDAEACFQWENLGGESPSDSNGFVVGKRWMDVTIAMWREDLDKGLLAFIELAEDPHFCDDIEWLRRVTGYGTSYDPGDDSG